VLFGYIARTIIVPPGTVRDVQPVSAEQGSYSCCPSGAARTVALQIIVFSPVGPVTNIR
jgi:hypothetical protein